MTKDELEEIATKVNMLWDLEVKRLEHEFCETTQSMVPYVEARRNVLNHNAWLIDMRIRGTFHKITTQEADHQEPGTPRAGEPYSEIEKKIIEGESNG